MHLNWCLKNISIRNVKGKGSVSKNTCCRNKLLCGCTAWKSTHFKLSMHKPPADTEKGRKQLDDLYSMCLQDAKCRLYIHMHISHL